MLGLFLSIKISYSEISTNRSAQILAQCKFTLNKAIDHNISYLDTSKDYGPFYRGYFAC